MHNNSIEETLQKRMGHVQDVLIDGRQPTEEEAKAMGLDLGPKFSAAPASVVATPLQ